ncbi:MAG: heme-binding domain-containing protein [Ferruginibacter sp.]
MVTRKKGVFSTLIVLIVLQFIQPTQNKSGYLLATDITNIYAVPDSVEKILKTACYDCHSDNTHYPLYAYVQPLGWVLNNHIRQGKKNLNFSEFGSYSKQKQKSKFRSIASQIDEGAMPVSSYTLMHKNARLTNKLKSLLIQWAQQSKIASEK